MKYYHKKLSHFVLLLLYQLLLFSFNKIEKRLDAFDTKG